MNDHVPDSSRLPLRAMVMVLLFLGLVLLLVGLQAMGSDSDSGDDATSVPAVTTTTTSSAVAQAPKADVRVFNIADVAGAADRTAGQLREAGWNVTEVGNLTLPAVTATTVYYGAAEGERAAAEAVAAVLQAPVEPRIPDVAEQPPGVIVVVTG